MIEIVTTGAIPRPVTAQLLRLAVERTFHVAKKGTSGSVAIAFISSERMKMLNKRWRQKNAPTDVLSFSPMEMPGKIPEIQEYWGDLFLCSSYIRQSAKRQHVPFRDEVLRVTIHGILHLFGYDHAELADEKKMFGLQERILAQVLTTV